MDDLEEEDQAQAEPVRTPSPEKPMRKKKKATKALSQPAERVKADDEEDFEGRRPRRRPCASQVWKLQPMHAHFMEKTVPECLFYGKNGT